MKRNLYKCAKILIAIMLLYMIYTFNKSANIAKNDLQDYAFHPIAPVLSHDVRSLLDNKYRMIPYDSIEMFANTVDTIIYFKSIKSEIIVLTSYIDNHVERNGLIINPPGKLISNTTYLENVKLIYDLQNPKISAAWKIDNRDNVGLACGNRIAVSLDMIHWNYTYIFRNTHCFNVSKYTSARTLFVCVEISADSIPPVHADVP